MTRSGTASIFVIKLFSERSPAKKCQVFNKNIFCWTVKLRKCTRGIFMSALSNESFSHRCALKRLYPLVLLRSNLKKEG